MAMATQIDVTKATVDGWSDSPTVYWRTLET